MTDISLISVVWNREQEINVYISFAHSVRSFIIEKGKPK